MNSLGRLLLFWVLALTLGACSTTGSKSDKVSTLPTDLDQYGRLLTGKELKDIFWAKHVKGTTAYRLYGMYTPWDTKYNSDGSFECKSSGMTDTGTVEVVGDQWCMKWNFFFRGVVCTHVRVKDGVYTDYTDEKLMNTFKVVDN